VSGGQRTVPLDDVHRALGATMTPFAGWSMPVRYASDLAEHHAVRERAGLFDVSHMGQIDVAGAAAEEMLEAVLVSRVRDLEDGRARYTMLCDDRGGVIDDVIVYRLEGRYLIIANASNTPAVLAALAAASEGRAVSHAYLEGRVLLALQGPAAVTSLAAASPDDRMAGAPDATSLRPFRAVETSVAGISVLVARTGYTGEDGFELACDGADGPALWEALLAAGGADGVTPCGLAARDTLRLEAGLPLHGHELGPELGPFETGFGRVVHFDDGRDFTGRAVLERIATTGPTQRIVGLVAEGRRAPRAGYSVLHETTVVGAITSGAPSPTLGLPIALAAVPAALAEPGTRLQVDLRGTLVPAEVVALPFVRRRG